MRGQRAEPVQQAAQLAEAGFLVVGGLVEQVVCEQLMTPRVEDQGQSLRVERELGAAVGHAEAGFVEHQTDMSGFEFSAVLVAENGQQQLVPQLGLERVPIDIEEIRK